MDIFETTSFWGIISKNRIEVPVIQRDYAQGRKSKKINQIREKFIDDLIRSLDTSDAKSRALHLDFVYGRIFGRDQQAIRQKNKEAIDNVLAAVQTYANQLELKIDYKLVGHNNNATQLKNTKLIPLDGQQRLTTLFLLHWYIFTRIECGSRRDEDRQVLRGFSYETRKTTRDFCTYLIDIMPHYDDTKKELSEIIIDHKIFFNEWQKDPSVQGMLVMLDCIHSRLRYTSEHTLTDYWELLTNQERITFYFLDMEQLAQTDELYVKMNARGKQLSDFEHFKASLYEFNSDAEVPLVSDEWKRSLDKEWTDIFWKNGNHATIDARLYNFLRSVNLYHYIASNEKKDIDRYLLERVRSDDPERNYIPFEDYKKGHFFTSESLKFVQDSLNALCHYRDAMLDGSLDGIFCRPFAPANHRLQHTFIANGWQHPDLWLRTYYYALLLFLKDKPDLTDEATLKAFRSWMRICRNLIYNTYIQGPENFIDAIKALSTMSGSLMTLDTDILGDRIEIPFFAGQAKEERKKLAYLRDKKWESPILAYENHPYFYGQIDFMFNLIKDVPNKYDVFLEYGQKLSIWFTTELEEKKRLRLQRALLTKGDYLIKTGYKHSFCVPTANLRAMNDNWRKVLNDPDKLTYIKELLDDGRDFIDIIDTYRQEDWRYFFIHYPSAIKYAHQRIIDYTDPLNIKLLHGSTYNGKNTNLHLYVLYLMLKQILKGSANIDVSHKEINNYPTLNSYPVIEIAQKVNKTVLLTIRYKGDLPDRGFHFTGNGLAADNYFMQNSIMAISNEKDIGNVMRKVREEVGKWK